MNRYKRLCAAMILVSFALTGCGSKTLEEGTELLKSGKYKEAVEQLKEAAEQDKYAAEAYRGIGMAKWELGEYEAARNAFESALENGAEKTAALHNLLGNCELKLNNPKAALNYYSLGEKCEDASKELLQEMKFNEIVAYEQLGEWDNARTKLADYVKDYPEDERAAKEAEFLETQ